MREVIEVLCLDGNGHYMNLHVINDRTKHMCTNVNLLALTMCYNYVRCKQWGRLSEGYMGPLCLTFIISCESIIVSE